MALCRTEARAVLGRAAARSAWQKVLSTSTGTCPASATSRRMSCSDNVGLAGVSTTTSPVSDRIALARSLLARPCDRGAEQARGQEVVTGAVQRPDRHDMRPAGGRGGEQAGGQGRHALLKATAAGYPSRSARAVSNRATVRIAQPGVDRRAGRHLAGRERVQPRAFREAVIERVRRRQVQRYRMHPQGRQILPAAVDGARVEDAGGHTGNSRTLINRAGRSQDCFEASPEDWSLDSTDLEILRLLQNDARMTTGTLPKQSA